MNNIQLYVGEGPDRRRVDSQEIKAVSIIYNLKNIKNYGLRNSSFTKLISILQTKNTREIFGSLFNINKSGGYDTSQKVFADLQENGLTIIKGSLRVTEITQDTYEVVLSTNQGTLLEKLGNKLIRGNIDSSDDLSWTGNPYQHTWTRSHVRDMLGPGVDPSNNGEGYIYPIIQYSDDLRFKWPSFQFDYLYAFAFADDYPVLPAIAAKQIFDRIFESNGYSYTMTEEMEDIFEKMYIPFNDDYLNYTSENWKFGLYYLGNPRAFSYPDTTVELTPISYSLNWFSSEVQPAYSVKGWTFQDNYLPGSANDVTGGYDYMYDRPSDASRGSTEILETFNNQRFDLPHGGTFQIDVSMWLYNSVAGSGDSEWSITTWNSFEGSNTTQIGSVTISGNSAAALTGSVQVTVSTKSFFYVHRSTESSTDINLVFGPWTLLELTEIDSLVGEEPVFDLNNMTPVNYKQKDFINDVLKAFNAYVTIDDVDETKLHIKTFDDFYSDYEYKDWSTKISEPKFKPIKDDFPSVTNFKLTDDNDIFTQDYLSKYPDGIYTESVSNDSEFATAENDIVLSFSPGYYNLWKNSDTTYAGYAKPPNGYEILKLTDDKQLKTSWKPRLLFAHAQDCSAIPYGSDRYENPSDASIYRLITLTPRMLDDTADASNCFMGWSSENTYFDTTAETGETLYNKFYKGDIERYLSNDSRLLTVKANLNARDINEGNFNDRIWIENSKIGSGYYIINEIKNYTPGGGLTDVELLRLDIIDDSYDTEIIPNVVFRSLTGPGGEGGSGTGGSGSGGGGGGSQDLESVTTFGNETTQGIVFSNSVVPASQVEIDATEDDELLIGGDTYITGDVSIAGDTRTTGYIYSADFLNTSGGVYGGHDLTSGGYLWVDEKSYLLGDVSVGADSITSLDTLTSHEPFVSGWTGDGHRLYLDDDDDSCFEVDNLRVRKTMSVFELILNKIRSTNGSLWVSDAVEAQWPGDASTQEPAGLYWDSTKKSNYFRVEENLNTLQDNDAILSQQFLGNNVHRYEWWVNDSSGTFIYVNGYEDQQDEEGPGDYMGCVNIDCDYFSNGTYGYDFSVDATNQAFKTNSFPIKGNGYVKVGWRAYDAGATGQISWAIYDSSDNKINTGTYSKSLSAYASQDSSMLIENFAGDTSCYIKFWANTSSTESDDFYIGIVEDYTLDSSLDVTGMTFVRMGNSSDPDRQGALYLTASDSFSPYLEVLDEMEDHNISNSNRKVRLGNLEGLSYLDASIGGYGLWSENVFLSGGIDADFGQIGAWTLNNNNLFAINDASKSITLDAVNAEIALYDASNRLVSRIHNNDLPHIEDIQSATEINYVDAYAKQYTDFTMSSGGYMTGTLNEFQYLGRRSGATSYLDNYTSAPSGTMMIPFEGSQAHSRVYWNLALDYDLSTNTDTRTYWPTPDPGDSAERHTYTLVGYYTFDSEVKAYYGDTSVLYTDSYSSAQLTSGFTGQEIYYQPILTYEDSSIYYKVDIDIYHNLQQKENITYYTWVEVAPGDGYWEEIYSYYIIDPLVVDYDNECYRLYINGEIQQTEIGADGLLAYYDSDEYIRFGPVDGVGPEDRTRFLEMAGGFESKKGGFKLDMYDGGNMQLFDSYDTTQPTLGGILQVKVDDSGYIATFQNDANSNVSKGLLIRSGQDTPTTSNELIAFEDGNGTDEGEIYIDATGLHYGTSSDAKLKEDIKDVSINSLELLNEVKPKDFKWKKTGARKVGYIAQDSSAIPGLTYYNESKERWGVSQMDIIPYLHKAILELKEENEELKSRLEKIEKK